MPPVPRQSQTTQAKAHSQSESSSHCLGNRICRAIPIQGGPIEVLFERTRTTHSEQFHALTEPTHLANTIHRQARSDTCGCWEALTILSLPLSQAPSDCPWQKCVVCETLDSQTCISGPLWPKSYPFCHRKQGPHRRG